MSHVLLRVGYYNMNNYFRNCVVGRGLIVKISHFASDMDVYASDYYRLDGKTPFPVRWMAWESIFLVSLVLTLFSKLASITHTFDFTAK